jgi:hypothetical protein
MSQLTTYWEGEFVAATDRGIRLTQYRSRYNRMNAERTQQVIDELETAQTYL